MPELVGLDGRRPGTAEPIVVIVPKGFVALHSPGELPGGPPDIVLEAALFAGWFKEGHVTAIALKNQLKFAVQESVAEVSGLVAAARGE